MDREAAKLKWIIWIFFVFVPVLAQFSLSDPVTYQDSRGEFFNWQHPRFSKSAAAAQASELAHVTLELYSEIDADYQHLLPQMQLSKLEKKNLSSLYNQDISFLYNTILDVDRPDSYLPYGLQSAVIHVIGDNDEFSDRHVRPLPSKVAHTLTAHRQRFSIADAEFIELQFRQSLWPEFTFRQFKEPSVLQKGWHIGAGDEQYVQYDRIITEVASRHNVEPALIKAIITVESYFDHKAESHRGAKGLMQLMPATAQELGVTDILDPEQNIDAGARYYKWLLGKLKGQQNLALAAYNAGIKHVMSYGGIPPFKETRNYVNKVQRYYKKYKVSPDQS